MYFKALGEKFVDAGQAEVGEMLKFIRNGDSWAEIGEHLGKDPDAARMKFRRWMRRFLPGV